MIARRRLPLIPSLTKDRFMPNFPSSEDRPDPSEQPIRARVPEHVSGGAFSTGVIVMTAQTEFILDFVQNLGRPHQIVSRVIMPHNVLPQLVDALHRNMELYRGRWGELPQPTGPSQSGNKPGGPATTPGQSPEQAGEHNPGDAPANLSPQPAALSGGGTSAGAGGTPAAGSGTGGTTSGNPTNPFGTGHEPPQATPPESPGQLPPAGGGARQASAQEIYDDLKIRDELLSGAYANAVMIGHGPHEFSFDFITNFYPHSAVSARVFLAAGQVPRFYDSLKGTWDQLRQRMQPPGGSPPPFPPDPDGDNPREPFA